MTDIAITSADSIAAKQDLDAFLGAPAARPWYKRPIILVGIVVALVALFFLFRTFSATTEAGYATQKVRRDDLSITVSATGNLAPTNQVEVGSEQSGLVDQVYVDNNDRVTRGQPLARLDPSRLRDTLVQNQAALAASQAQVAQQQASAVQANANLARLEEVWRVSGGKVPSRTELDTGRAEAKRASAAVRAAQAQVTQARAQVSSAQTNLSKSTIYSPVNGVVLSRSVDPGQTVAASFSAPVLFTIAEDLSKMKLEVKVDEADVGEVHEGQHASFTVDAYPGRTFEGQITRVDVGANATSSSSNSSSTASTSNVVAYTAVLSVDNPDLALRPGMTATADIVTSAKQNVLVVPNAALRFSPEREAARSAQQSGGVTSVLVPRGPRRGGGGNDREATIGRGSRQTVYVLGADGQPEPVEVTVGDTNGTVTEIQSGGLKAGAEVVTGRLSVGESRSSGSGGQKKAGFLPLALLAVRRRRWEVRNG
ncbi:efflux RND transporter periplasmic adaptor subunit [Sphingosinicella sp. BN140058]|uniref:efflux RND transporter periplasmic adaptor subunit n=1 Tax=Sphingosinicella sp. BN140058 TaxID=1892855 RepID=UPI001011FE9D|nr:efflux RND transporter periplasmic adaptor subunit [Sphingosinicella sp. BN140058]QAY78219.1 efflux RND transporter periplasmic adaptor subunit [Sphingosinicella sp. BN140058]